MLYRFQHISAAFRSPLGRLRLLRDLYQRSLPIVYRAACLYRRLCLRGVLIVAVVGSFGKSTATKAVSASLRGGVEKISERNSLAFVAREILLTTPFQRYKVIEVGISGVGQMVKQATMLRPGITIVTAIGSEHNRSLGSLEVARSEKFEMVRILPKTGLAVLNGDDPHIQEMIKDTPSRIKTYGMGEENDIRASDIRLEWPSGTRFTLHMGGRTHPMRTHLLGRHMVYPALAAITVASFGGRTIEEIQASLEKVLPAPGRMQPVRLSIGAFLLRDDYKSALETIHAALDVLSEIPARRRIIVLGEVSEPMGSAGPIYRDVGMRVAKIAARVVLVASRRNFQAYKTGMTRGGLARASIARAASHSEAVGIIESYGLKEGDVVLVKGRDTQRLERISFALMGRKVRCNADFCGMKATRCAHCSEL